MNDAPSKQSTAPVPDSTVPVMDNATATAEKAAVAEDDGGSSELSAAFYLIWAGQFASMMGTGLTAFALNVWVFQRHGSVLDFTTLTLFSTLPALLLMPWTGSIADRYNKRIILLSGETVAMLSSGIMALLFWRDSFALWQLYALQIILSVSLAFQVPAAFATISAIVPKKAFPKAGGMFQIATAIAQLSAPMLAAVIMHKIGITALLTIDMLTYLFALLGLILAKFPPKSAEIDPDKPRRDALKDLAWSWHFMRERLTMLILYGYTSMGAFLSGMVIVLVTPLVLSGWAEQQLAWVNTCGAFGILIGGILMVVWGGPKKFTPAMLGFNTVQGLAIAIAGFANSITVLCVCAFIVMVCSSSLATYNQSILRRKVPKDRHGTFAALIQTVSMSLLPLSALLGGTLSYFVLEPALLPGGALADSVGQWIGTGKGRGTGFLFLLVGALGALVSLTGIASRRLRGLEDEIRDAY